MSRERIAAATTTGETVSHDKEKEFTWEEEYLREYFAMCDCGVCETDAHRISVTVHLALLPANESYYHCEVFAASKTSKRRLSTDEILNESDCDRAKAKARAEQLGCQLVELLKHWERQHRDD